MNLAKIEIRKKDELPDKRAGSIDYTPVFRKVATISKDEAVLIPIDKAHYVANIQNALDKEFEHAKYKSFQRTIDGQLYCCIAQVS